MTRLTKNVGYMLVAFLTLGLYAQSAVAEDYDVADQGSFYFSPGLVFFSGPDTDAVGAESGAMGGGIALGVPLSERINVELLAGSAEFDFDNTFGSGSDDAQLVWLDFLFKMKPVGEVTPFFLIGGGRTNMEFDNVRRDLRDSQYNAGIGAFLRLSKRIAARADLRGVVSHEEGGGVEPFAFVGLTGFLGDMTPPVPPDTDGDGVPDVNDRCPNTPPGVEVGPDGCERDSDGDGVVDSADACPGTPAGVAVDDRGCPLDSDGDGVPDYQDACPGTPAGTQVDERGCPPQIDETVTIDLNLEFDFDSAELRNAHYPEIRSAIDFMRQFPNTEAVLEGHTDSRGAAAYNQRLSERRAQSVEAYMVEQGIASERLSTIGYGESKPIDTNDTEEGRQHNRRVSAQVSTKK